MPNQQMSRKEEKEKKKKARGAFALWLKRLRAACKTLDSINEWYELMEELTDLLQEYFPVIPADIYERIQNAMRPVDSTRKALMQACKVLGLEVENLLKALPTGRSAGKVFGGVLVAAAVVVGGLVGYAEFTKVDIAVHNDGCSTIYMPSELPIPIPGVSLPNEPIPSGGSATVSLPRISVEVDATQPGRISVIILGASVSYNLGGSIVSIQMDGQEILGQRFRADLGGRQQHELVVRCR